MSSSALSHLGPGGGELALDEERPGERGPGPLAGRVEAHAVLGVGDGLVDGGLEGRDLERVVRVVEARQLDPGQAALGLRGDDTLQGLDRGGEVRRVAVEEELVGGEDPAVGRELGGRLRPPLRPEQLRHQALLGGDAGGDDARRLLLERPRRDGPAPVLLRPHLARRCGSPRAGRSGRGPPRPARGGPERANLASSQGDVPGGGGSRRSTTRTSRYRPSSTAR